MGKKSNDKKLFHVMYLRIDGNTRQRLDAKAQLEDCTASETVRNAIAEYLDKDTDWQGQLEANMQRLQKDIGAVRREIKLFSELWMHWTEFYFTYTRSLGDMGEEQKQLLVGEGRRRSQLMVESFRKSLQARKPGLMESILADYLMEDVQ